MSKINRKKPKIFMAMSGGVDSSVAALLLSAKGGSASGGKNKGYDVVGVYMKGWSLTGCAEQDAADARRAAGVLKIPFYVFDFEDEYKKTVVDYMVSGYAKGETPNPDVMCNREIKFGLFLKKALTLGADYIATGHYVRATCDKKHVTRNKIKKHVACRLSLVTAHDSAKDQSYFLWTLTQEQLKHCLFPIGDYTKPQVRALAKKYGLPTAEKPDSQGVCFVGEIDVAGFLKERLGKNSGPIKTLDGKTIGAHDGVIFYTIGQRKGIGIKGSLPGEQGKVYYVAGKDMKTNTLWVAESENEKLFAKELTVKDINWISGSAPKLPLKCLARIRYRQPLQQAIIATSNKLQDTKKSNESMLRVASCMSLIFDVPQRAITPGQSAVFYDKNGAMLGGGIII
ncbi:tRNA 2-thiouridine(34) synthase MnmA [Candidatus Azambacteria bacterium]|nr:tRNA 2-thiouridine(34) synthase MnmA [Candidatus Azambacteria bacterium]